MAAVAARAGEKVSAVRNGSIYELSAPFLPKKLPGLLVCYRPLASIFQVARARPGLAPEGDCLASVLAYVVHFAPLKPPRSS